MTEHFVVSAQQSDGPWRVLAGGDRTDGQVIFGEALLPPMTAGPSLHVHTREDEAAYVIDGVLTVQVGERRVGGLGLRPSSGCLGTSPTPSRI